MAEMFGEPLSDDIQVLGHRMAPDQAIGVHNDNPGLGYENYRVIVQFTESHEEDDGGLLNLHASDRPEDIFQTVAPFPNMGFGFEMGAGSFHSVTAVKRKDRMALIFNFWHVGNTPAVERAVNEALTDAGIAMGDPPRKADPVADARDTAALLRHWGEPDSVVAEGFREVLLDAGGATLTPVVALAHWVVRAPARMFSRELWHRAYAEIEAGRSELTTEARALADLIFPVEVAALEQAQR
jgi:hypothetical protein